MADTKTGILGENFLPLLRKRFKFNSEAKDLFFLLLSESWMDDTN